MSLRLNSPMPDLAGATEWINGQPDAARLAGHPTLVYFWSVSCSICHENMAKLALWRYLYAPKGLRFVAIHVPRQLQDIDVASVRAALENFMIADPCGLDNAHAIKSAFATAYLPAYFLFDRAGKLRGRTGGDAGLGLLEQPLRRLFDQEHSAPPHAMLAPAPW